MKKLYFESKSPKKNFLGRILYSFGCVKIVVFFEWVLKCLHLTLFLLFSICLLYVAFSLLLKFKISVTSPTPSMVILQLDGVEHMLDHMNHMVEHCSTPIKIMGSSNADRPHENMLDHMKNNSTQA